METLSQFPSSGSILEALPEGVVLHRLTTHVDRRGTFTEVFRNEWALGPDPPQWNLVWSEPNVLRGVHVHTSHTDYITVVAGEIVFALHDARSRSRTHLLSVLFRMKAESRHIVVIPPGVAHAFYSPDRSCHLYGVTHYFDGTDEHGCHWDDPQLRLDWPCDSPVLSERDLAAGSYQAMVSALGL